MTQLSLMLLLSAPSYAAPARPPIGPRPLPQERRVEADPWEPREYGALPTTCDAPPTAPAVLARLALIVCDASVQAPSPDLENPKVSLPGLVASMSAEVKAPFDYEPPSWAIVHRLEASDDSRHVVEFWPADPRELPGSAAHDAYVVVSRWTPDGPLTRGIAFKLRLDGRVEPFAWTVDASGGAHVPLERADVRRRLDDELAFWSKR